MDTINNNRIVTGFDIVVNGLNIYNRIVDLSEGVFINGFVANIRNATLAGTGSKEESMDVKTTVVVPLDWSYNHP